MYRYIVALLLLSMSRVVAAENYEITYIMEPDNIKSYAEAFKNVSLALAIIIGGLWTLYIFHHCCPVNRHNNAI
jgi:hypothetical protein